MRKQHRPFHGPHNIQRTLHKLEYYFTRIDETERKRNDEQERRELICFMV